MDAVRRFPPILTSSLCAGPLALCDKGRAIFFGDFTAESDAMRICTEN